MTFSLLGSFLFQLKTLLLGETIRRAKVTSFSSGDENFARRKISPDKVFRIDNFFSVLLDLENGIKYEISKCMSFI